MRVLELGQRRDWNQTDGSMAQPLTVRPHELERRLRERLDALCVVP